MEPDSAISGATSSGSTSLDGVSRDTLGLRAFERVKWEESIMIDREVYYCEQSSNSTSSLSVTAIAASTFPRKKMAVFTQGSNCTTI